MDLICSPMMILEHLTQLLTVSSLQDKDATTHAPAKPAPTRSGCPRGLSQVVLAHKRRYTRLRFRDSNIFEMPGAQPVQSETSASPDSAWPAAMPGFSL